jgi:ABC-type transport system involved in multi-copper enzyme maturation permease subunit
MTAMWTIVHLTLIEARRKRIVTAAAICGAGYLLLYGAAMVFAARTMDQAHTPLIQRQLNLGAFTLIGCYAANVLASLFAVLLPVDTLSGEIDSGVMQTIASKPLRRADIVIGKWIGYGIIIASYMVALLAGVFLSARLLGGYVPADVVRIVLLMLLEVVVLATVSIAGGTRLSTVTNGVVACGYFGLAFMGGLIEQIGTIAGIQSARNIGVIASLISPTDALWRLGAYYLTPAAARNLLANAPFGTASVPTVLMVWWALALMLAVLAWAVWQFSRRAL